MNGTFYISLPTGPADYDGGFGDFIFGIGSVTGVTECTDVLIANDEYKEVDETFTFALGSSEPAVHINDLNTLALVSIIDDEGNPF